jgi:hypothetical protein
MATFIRIFDYAPDKKTILREKILNVDHIWKIEVVYFVPDEFGVLEEADVKTGLETTEAQKAYRIFVGNEEVGFISDNLDDPVTKVIEDIYKKSTKGLDLEPPRSHFPKPDRSKTTKYGIADADFRNERHSQYNESSIATSPCLATGF